MLTPDLKQNIFYLIYFTVSHNALALLYSCGILFSVGYSIYKPSRKSVLLLLGFLILLFGFEYDKHIVTSLREQTLNALITIQEHNKVRRIVNIFTLKALPILLPLAGWTFIFLSLYLHLKNRLFDKKK
ncbi:hypothetical protein A2334_02355 [Candidatus Roizmanbacteria bacterium RIFOXYB2_FULL_38_10]|uniref:Uncharacterized protein n=1 Tax=Candidatus Roizmanbacteria bacterium RIFOXYD1_FULL_38_12 TaxID=1802093 RepID=A0A1F7L004_9BACT|nr:MAG: hypothetical protein A3K47_01615 [Candidatus Roizmanbacteria bacterium RIFOXYA2_FULL_38_14]OGK63482.1 MAG: hypothetical protein A3K27_01615 [Candidatus Roizmanbacteria bacterium RIFOXYA1_FULL_37_12]OGK65328.1 MAG: hypothetical protein A3K38_01615 [Candidatus Roizmanbacteria bacterium RIFOXYB1_FULL_40_23]OGK67958.1 MAG: hypothetical protein A2334_02355 [Candidatus Roizmanbacteria bacterium RIFOXYB2_FULL_38_10]OGK69733.1 MAG: hypothetical protein A3K21_01620 [Candidatus Roizmanbacteria ba